MRFFVLFAAVLPVVLTGCGGASTPESTAKKYIDLVRNDEQSALPYNCTLSEDAVSEHAEFVSQFSSVKIDSIVSEADVSLVNATGTKDGADVAIGTIVVGSDELFQERVDEVAEFNSLILRSNETIENADKALEALGDDRPDTRDAPELMEPPERSSYSRKEFCVTKLGYKS